MSESLQNAQGRARGSDRDSVARRLKVLGPVARDGAVGFDEVRNVSDLAVAIRDTQEPGRYRLVQSTAGEIFGVVNGAGSLKPFFSLLRKRCLK
jgi:hypothetical protein